MWGREEDAILGFIISDANLLLFNGGRVIDKIKKIIAVLQHCLYIHNRLQHFDWLWAAVFMINGNSLVTLSSSYRGTQWDELRDIFWHTTSGPLGGDMIYYDEKEGEEEIAWDQNAIVEL